LPGGSLRMEMLCSEERKIQIPTFLCGKFPITQKQWKAVSLLPKIERHLTAYPSYFKGENHPVESISWYDAVEFCKRLHSYSGLNYRLPNEWEWEFACRGHSPSPYHFGDKINGKFVNFAAQGIAISSLGTSTVGSYNIANSFGLYDMHGNVWEWCRDFYEGARDLRVLKGGSFSMREVSDLLLSARIGNVSYLRLPAYGFRVVIETR